jgi:UDP-N-acetylmuramyl pentapeptide phosphotransferase/UDP-N-acetylglucosamine-1-phosphate transferase
MLVGLTLSSRNLVLTVVPIICLLARGYMGYSGRAFIGNVGTFSIGLTLAVYAILMNIKTVLLIALVPHIINSILILYSNYVLHDKAETLVDEKGLLYSHGIRSLRTLVLHYRRMTEHQAVIVIYLITALSTALGLVTTLVVH